MVEFNSHATHNIHPNLICQQQIRLNKINEVKDYFVAEIKERELISKRLSKYIASFGCFDKSSIVLSVTSGSIFIALFATVIGVAISCCECNINTNETVNKFLLAGDKFMP